MARFENQRMQREDPQLLRAIARSYAEELSAISDYTYASILLEKALGSAAAVFSSVAMDEMRHHRVLGALLKEQGAGFALSTAVRNTPYRLNEDEDSHAAVVARRILLESAREEEGAAKRYHAMAAAARTEAVREVLEALAKDEEGHAKALCALEKRLAFS